MSEDVVERTLTDPDYLIRLATALKEERAARAVAEQKVGELQPKAKALDLLADASGSYSVAEAAKMLSGAGCAMRVRDLADWLSSHGWVYRRDGHWVASQERVKNGHLMMRAYQSTGRLKDGSSFGPGFKPLRPHTNKPPGTFRRFRGALLMDRIKMFRFLSPALVRVFDDCQWND